MREKDECRAGIARHVRKLRLSLGYPTAASFARAIGYPPSNYSRYEHQGFVGSGTMILFVNAVENAGLGLINIEWLLDAGPPKWRVPPPAKQARQAVRTDGNVVHVNFAR